MKKLALLLIITFLILKSFSNDLQSSFVNRIIETDCKAAGQCVQYRVEQIRIIHAITPVFNQIGPFCYGSPPQTLPLTSTNGISGTWSPATIATNNSGLFTYNFISDDDCAIPVTMTIEIYNPITVDVKYDPITILGGKTTLTVSASGGSGTFTSGTGQIELGSGNHDFTVTDNANCTGTKTIYISEPQQLNLEARILTAIPCFGGNALIQAIASGGQAPFTYKLTGGKPPYSSTGNNNSFYVTASNVPYHFEVIDANGQFARSNILDVTNPPKIELTASATQTSCAGMNDGTATVKATFGQPPYKYKWLNGQTTQTATGLSAGTYRVEVSDQLECYWVQIDVVVSDPSVKTLQASATDPKCHDENGTILFTFTNVPDGLYHILYDGGQFIAVRVTDNQASVPAMPGTYTNLKLVINGCSTASGVTTAVNPTPALIINAEKVIMAQPTYQNVSGAIVIKEPETGTGYVYSIDNGLMYQSLSTFSDLSPKIYQLRIKNISTGCVSDPLQIEIKPAPNFPSIANIKYLSDILVKVFPNPTTGIVNIEISNGTDKDIEISVTNLLGVEVFRKEMTDGTKFQIVLTNQVNGIYILKVIIGNQQSISKIVLRKE